jgi:hypothetical protein
MVTPVSPRSGRLQPADEAFSVSEGQPESRMHEWSPEQVSSSTPKRVRTTRTPEPSLSRSLWLRKQWLERNLTVLDPASTVLYGP